MNNGKSSNPPSPVAVRLLEMGRQYPDRLIALLAKLDGPAEPRVPEVEVRVVEVPAPVPPKAPRRVKSIVLGRGHLSQWINLREQEGWMRLLPETLRVVDVTLYPKRRVVKLTVESESFPPVPDGAPIPEIDLG